MNKDISIQTERLDIRPLKVSDVNQEYICGLNDPEINRYLFDVRFSVQTEKSVVEFVEKNAAASNGILFGLFLREEKNLIGTIRISGISPIHYSCSLGICIFVKNYWKKGIGTEAVKAVVDYLFKGLGLHYVEAGAYIENRASITLFQKAGFEIQAEYKNKFRYDKNFMPVVFLGRVNENFDRRFV